MPSFSNPERPAVSEVGLSLVEVLVTTCVVVSSIAAAAHIFVLATRADAEAQYSTYETVLATQKMEELRTTLPAGPMDAVDYTDSSGTVLIGAGSPRAVYERHWTIEPLPGALDIVVITVTVARRHANPRAGTVRLITLRGAGPSEEEASAETTVE
jgi:hypothetical protein